MNTNKKLWGAFAAFLTMGAFAASARATNPGRVNIQVTITAAKSVSVDGVDTSTRAHTWTGTSNQAFDNSASSITVRNDGILTETWALSATNAGATWTLGTSTAVVGADEFALQAVFGSSNTLAAGCGSVTATTWNSGTAALPLTGTPATYTSTLFASTQLAQSGGVTGPDSGNNMFGGNKRVLCYRVIMPQSTSVTATQNVQVVVTAQ